MAGFPDRGPLQEVIDAAVPGWGDVRSRPMFGTRAYLANGRLFAALGDMGLLLKLPPQARDALLQAGTAVPFTYGAGLTFGEWIAIPQAPSESNESLLALVRQSYDYVQTSPARPKVAREKRRFRKRQF